MGKRIEQKLGQPGQTVLEYARANNLTVDWIYRLARMGRLSHVRVYGRVFITEPNTKPSKSV
jgi:hypothetical protein